MVMIVEGNDVLYNYLPNFKLQKDFETYNDKIKRK